MTEQEKSTLGTSSVTSMFLDADPDKFISDQLVAEASFKAYYTKLVISKNLQKSVKFQKTGKRKEKME